MARILISKHKSASLNRLWESLSGLHEIHCVQNPAEAMKFLHESGMPVDLIISSVYDDDIDLFSFIRAIKGDPALSTVPVLCFSMQRTHYATLLDVSMEHAAIACGADKYLSMDSFCRAKPFTDSCDTCAWAGELCDYEALRSAIGDMLKSKD